MIESKSFALAGLILTRQTLICRGIELEIRFEVLSVLQSTRLARRTPLRSSGEADEIASLERNCLMAEIALMPSLIEDMDRQIARAWRGLGKLSGDLPK